MSKKEINQEAGIGKGQKREDIILTPWIKENMCLVFGEEIRPQDLSLKNSRDDPITPDIFGIDKADVPLLLKSNLGLIFQVTERTIYALMLNIWQSVKSYNIVGII